MARDLDALRPRSSMWVAVGLASLLAHGGVAAGLASYEPPPPPPERIPVDLKIVEVPPPEPPKPPEPPPEPEKPPAPEPPPEPEKPREAVKQDDPPPPPKKKPRRKKTKKKPVEPPKPNPAPPPAEPTPDKPPEPPPMMMGLQFEGVATSKTGIAVQPGAHDGARDGAVDGTGRKGPRAPTPPADGDAEETVPIAGVTSLPRLIKEVKPDFPEELKRRGIEGKVVLSLEIGTNGRVRKARVVSRLHPELDKLARRAALKLKFEPAKVRGTPVAVNLPYTFYFVID